MKINKNIFRLVIGILFSIAMLGANAQLFSDDFSDGNFSTNPSWTGNTANFIVNGSEQLQLDDAVEGQSQLVSVVNEVISENVEWRFYIKQSFSPSGNNNSRVYLMSTSEDLSYTGSGVPELEGYYIQFGESGSEDAIELFRNDALGTSESVARGIDGFISGSFEITVKIVRSSSGNWEIWADPNAGEEYVLQSTGTDNSYSSLSYFGWVCKYTLSNSDSFYLDDLYAGEPILDTESPQLIGVAVNSENELFLDFNEPLSQVSAETLLNYSVFGIGNPVSIVLESTTEVTLTFGQNFVIGEENQLTVSGVEDLNNNAIISQEWTFTYFDLGIPEPGDLIFNELFVDPTPAVGLPEEEWFEIYNTSNNTFDLGQLEFYNSTTLNSLESYFIQPNEYVIVSNSAGAAALSIFGTAISANPLTALSNTEDSLTLLANGQVIDVVVYNDSWYQDDEKDNGGWSLERINPFTQCSGANNWIATSSVLGGTPGVQNSQYSDVADLTPPEVESVFLLNSTQIFIQASESLNEDLSLIEISLENGIGVVSQNLTTNNTGILLNLESPIIIGQPFVISLENLTDCEGNTNFLLIENEVLSGFPAQAGEVLITEIMADPSPQVGLPEVEYIEIFNTTENYIDISDLDLDGATFEEQVILEPFQYKIIMSKENIGGNFIFSDAIGMDGWSSSFLTNSGKILSLVSNNELLDEVSYDITWYRDSDKDSGGWSLERINLEDPCSDRTNWSASESIFGGSPGELNSIFSANPDETAPDVSYSYVNSEGLVIVFNEPIEASSFSIESFLIDDVESLSVEIIDDYTVFITMSSIPTNGQILSVEINDISDCWGNLISDLEIEVGLAEEAEIGDILINEILTNPLGSGSDYIEIYNHSSKVIALENWLVAKRDDEGTLDQEKLISSFPFTLFPGEYLLLAENVHSIIDVYPNAAQDRIWIMDLPSFSNDEGNVVLLMPDLEISDELSYSVDYHFGLLDETDGVSLERVSFDVATQYSENWSSASSAENYGTPGYVNSQNQALQGAQGMISIYPEVFAPEGGSLVSNHLEISYEFEFGDASASVRIYDRNGVLVKNIVTNELIGPRGTFFWDGLDNNLQKLPIGIYVVYFEVFTLSGKVESYKAPAVIGQL